MPVSSEGYFFDYDDHVSQENLLALLDLSYAGVH